VKEIAGKTKRRTQMMRRIGRTVYCLTILVLFWVIGFPAGTVSAASKKTANNMNVVFVLDGSGSMAATDRYKLRFEAMDLFLGLSTETGNYMGAIVFDDGILLEQDIVHINGKATKNSLSNKVKNVTSTGDTDIGKAIYQAVQMLEKSGHPDLPSSIILLSDGNTDLQGKDSAESLKKSNKNKSDAIDIARKKDINIHSVCLNTNGRAKMSELQDISDSTGGTCVEVKSANDLKDVFNQFYNIIYSTKTINLVKKTIPDSGELKVPFTIPLIGVKEANIIINTLNPDTEYNLFNPDGYGYTRSELKKMSVKAKTFTVIKVQKPQPGRWKLVVRGARRDQVKVDMVYNTDLTLKLEKSAVHSQGKVFTWELSAKIYNEGKAVSKKAVYKRYPIKVTITKSSSGKKKNGGRMTPDGSQGRLEINLDDYGKYELQAFCEIDGMPVKSNVLSIQIKNSKPEWKENPIVIDQKTGLFKKKNYNLDLVKLASDAEDTTLDYSIKNSAFSGDNVTLEGSVLKIKINKCGNGKLTVVATDSKGAAAEAEVEIKVKSVKAIELLVLALVLVVLVLIPLVRHIIIANRPIRGTIQILAYGDEGTEPPETFDGGKGKIKLSRYINPRQDTGINLEKCYLAAGKKDSFIYLVAADGCYTDSKPGLKREKKIRIDKEKDVNISNDKELGKGMRIFYKPY